MIHTILLLLDVGVIIATIVVNILNKLYIIVCIYIYIRPTCIDGGHSKTAPNGCETCPLPQEIPCSKQEIYSWRPGREKHFGCIGYRSAKKMLHQCHHLRC